ncbi:MAG: mechanosensitive ion channel protein MscS [Flavobacteriales bacterium]|nr:mechanosensitive ion channel protein MscS [Flavobacteriales bacterium]
MDTLNTEKAIEILTNEVQGWMEGLVATLPNLVVAIVVIVLFYFLARISRYTINKGLTRTKLNQGLIDLASSTGYIAVNIFGLFVALDVLELEKTVTSLLAGVGVIGLALGFAFQSTAANYVSGMILAFRTPFHIGEIVQSGDVMGIVEKINLRSTTIKTFQGTDVIIPNKDVLQNPIHNYQKSGKRRIDLACGISYGDDLEKVKELSIKAIQSVESIDNSKDVEFYYNAFGDSSINFYIFAWSKGVAQGDYLKAQSEMIMALKKCYDENDISIPFPIRTLDFGIKGGEKLNRMLNDAS